MMDALDKQQIKATKDDDFDKEQKPSSQLLMFIVILPTTKQ